MAELVHVPLSNGKDYDIHIGAGVLSDTGILLRPFARSQRVVIVSQPPIAKRYARIVSDSLVSAGFDAPQIVLYPAGERYKTLRTMDRLYGELYELRPAIDRKTLLIALGGGVVGDMVGFLAASYLRGLDYVQIPTTLLAMVDSAVGGKTGIDYRSGKNLIGAFHQPKAVITDTMALRSLPRREMAAGLAEVIKYGVISDSTVLQVAGNALADQEKGIEPTIEFLIRRSCEIKADIVTRDEFETTGLRAILNFGHTIGHAVESATDYKRYKHGEAVAIGMHAAACIGESMGVTAPAVREQILSACIHAGLPVELPKDITDDTLIGLLGRDKKAESGVARFVLARSIGDILTGVVVNESVIRSGLQYQRNSVAGGTA